MNLNCPNYSHPDWIALEKRYGEKDAHRIYIAHGGNIPRVLSPTEIKKAIGFRSGPISERTFLAISKKLDRFNSQNNTSHSITQKPASETSLKIELHINYMPKPGRYKIYPNARMINDLIERRKDPQPIKEDTDAYVERLPEIDDIVQSRPEANEYIVNGEVYPTLVDAYNAAFGDANTLAQLYPEFGDAVNQELDAKLMKFLSDNGISVEVYETLKTERGMTPMAIADITNNIIRVAKGEMRKDSLSEETSHFVIEHLERSNPRMFNAMYNAAKNSPLYSKVVEVYGDLYEHNERRLVKETMGKILAKEIIKKAESYPSADAKSKNLIQRIWDSIVNFFKKISNEAFLYNIEALYQNVADRVLNNRLKLNLEGVSADSMYQARKMGLANNEDLQYAIKRTIARLERRAKSLRSRETKKVRESAIELSESVSKMGFRLSEGLADLQVYSAIGEYLLMLNSVQIANINANVLNKYDANPNKTPPSQLITDLKDFVLIHRSNILEILNVVEGLSIEDQQWMVLEDTQLLEEMVKNLKGTLSELNRIDRFASRMHERRIVEIVRSINTDETSITPEELLYKVDSDISWLGKMFGPLHSLSDETLRLVYRMLSDVYNESHREAYDVGVTLRELQTEFMKKYDLRELHELDENGKKTGYLISSKKWSVYHREELKTKERIVRRIAELRGETIPKDADIQELFQEIYERYIDAYDGIKSRDESEAIFPAKELDIYIEEFKKFNNKYKIKYNGKLIPNPPVNEKFGKLMKDPVFAKYYNEIANIHERTKSLLPVKFNKDEYKMLLPQIKKDWVQIIASSKGNVLNQLKETLKDEFRIAEDDVDYGDLLHQMVDEHGNRIKNVPIYYTTRVSDPELLSDDIASMYTAFAEMAFNFNKLMSKTADLRLIQESIASRKVDLGKETKAGAESNAYEALTTFINRNVFGMRKSVEVLRLPNGKTINYGKALDALGNWVRSVNLFMNTGVAVSGGFKAAFEHMLMTTENKYITVESNVRANKEFTRALPSLFREYNKRNKRNKAMILIEYFRGVGNINEIFSKLDMKSRLTRVSMEDFIYGPLSIGDFTVGGHMVLSILFNNRIVDGELMSKIEFDRKYKDPRNQDTYDPKKEWSDYGARTLYDAFEIVNGKPVIKKDFEGMITNDDLNRITGTIMHQKSIITGMLSDLDRAAIYNSAAGRLVMLHRSWLITGFAEKFKSDGYNYQTGEREIGPYLATGRFIASIIANLKSKKPLIAQWKELPDHHKRAIRRTMYDAAITMVVWIVARAFNKMVDDDPDPDLFDHYMAFYLNRILMEQGAFWNPTEIPNILNSPSAAMSIVDDMASFLELMTDWSEIERGPYKGMTKFQRALIKSSLFKNIYQLPHIEESNRYLKSQII